jgi:two-component system phosphate regulon sensor histidine kinase PhoR
MNKLAKGVRTLSVLLESYSNAGELDPTPIPDLPALEPLVTNLRPVLSAAEKDKKDALELLSANRLLARDLRRTYASLDQVNIGIVFIDTADNIQHANRHSSVFLNEPASGLVGSSIESLLRREEDLQGITDLFSLSREGTAVDRHTSIELPGNAEKGRDDAVVSLHQVLDGNEMPIGHVLVFQPNNEIKEFQSSHCAFVDGVAHELRTPLTSIRACVEMLIDGDTADVKMQRDFYNIIYEETYRLSNLIDNMLNLSMLESGTASLEVSPIRLKRLLEEAIAVVVPQCEQKSIELHVELDDRLPVLDIDKSLFTVAVMNLLGNAVKYTPEGGTISVRTSSHDDGFWIEVIDSGIGISKDDLPHVFDKFYRAHAAEDEVGSGVGLPTARQIAQLHGGEIQVKSKLGQGSEFVISLPRSLINTSVGE